MRRQQVEEHKRQKCKRERVPSGDAVDHGVSDPFGCEQDESENGEHDLNALGI